MSALDSAIRNPHSAIAYACNVPGFEGPLDVLLRLIEREELDITAISLALVADQFVAYIAAQPDSDPALLAEFAAVASRLLLLKTRGLFPRAPEAATVESSEGPDEDDLVRQLLEYRQIKAAAAGLATRDRAGARAFAPLGTPAHATAGAVPEITLAPARPFDLLRAVHRRLARQPATPRVLALIPRISVGEMAARILESPAHLAARRGTPEQIGDRGALAGRGRDDLHGDPRVGQAAARGGHAGGPLWRHRPPPRDAGGPDRERRARCGRR